MNPYVLSAISACWSLRRAWAALVITDNSTASAVDGLKAWAPARGRAGGGPGDGIAGVILTRAGAGSRYDRLADTVRLDVEQALWLLKSALPDKVALYAAPFDQITEWLPQADPDTARDVGRYLNHADQAVRRALRMVPDWRTVPNNPPCGACGDRLLRVQASAPDPRHWTITCTGTCQCLGEECGCGMDFRERGLPHVWANSSALNLAGLARRRVRAQRATTRDDVGETEGVAA